MAEFEVWVDRHVGIVEATGCLDEPQPDELVQALASAREMASGHVVVIICDALESLGIAAFGVMLTEHARLKTLGGALIAVGELFPFYSQIHGFTTEVKTAGSLDDALSWAVSDRRDDALLCPPQAPFRMATRLD